MLFYAFSCIGQELLSFEYAECQSDSIELSEINEISVNQDIAIIRVRTYGNCIGNFTGDVDVSPEIIDLIFEVKPDSLEQDNGLFKIILIIHDCDCLYDLTYKIRSLDYIGESKIRINGKTIQEMNNDKQDIKIELEGN